MVRYLWAKTKLFLNLMRAPGTVREAWYREDGGLCHPVSSMSSSSSSEKVKVKQSMLESDTQRETRSPCPDEFNQSIRMG